MTPESPKLRMQALGRQVRDTRAQRRLSLEALAARAGVSRSMLSEVERGRQGPDRARARPHRHRARHQHRAAAGRGAARAGSSCCGAASRTWCATRPAGSGASCPPCCRAWSSSSCARRIPGGRRRRRVPPHIAGSREYLAMERGTLTPHARRHRPHAARRRQHLLRRRLLARLRQPRRAATASTTWPWTCPATRPSRAGRAADPMRRRRRGGGHAHERPARRSIPTSSAVSAIRPSTCSPTTSAACRARPVFTPMTPGRARDACWRSRCRSRGVDAGDACSTRCRAQVLTHPMGNGHPRFFGWVNSPPAPLGVLADFLAAGVEPELRRRRPRRDLPRARASCAG